MKFDFSKSIETDFRNKLQSFEVRQNIQGKNILYITYQIDKILKIIDSFKIDTGLQKQVDEYFEDNAEDKAEQVPEN